jgi:glycosyltransferase involved in cell wall biosynthesis
MLSMMMMIPNCYNESQNILSLLSKIYHDLKPGSNIKDVVLVVDDDSSPDRSASRVEEYARG